tara:strand:+ start:622 stop:936 length:315 start_codon:yes stop_codon:yes gene_type:complete
MASLGGPFGLSGVVSFATRSQRTESRPAEIYNTAQNTKVVHWNRVPSLLIGAEATWPASGGRPFGLSGVVSFATRSQRAESRPAEIYNTAQNPKWFTETRLVNF